MSDQMSDDRLIAVAKQAATDRAQASYRAFNQDRIADESLIQEALVKTLMDAYRAGEDLTKLDLPSGIDAAAVVAAELARQLGISLATAQMIVGLGKGATSEIVYDPRDPNYDPQKAKLGRTAAIMAGAPVYYPPPPTSSGVDTGSGTGSGGGAARDPMADLRKQLELEREMLTLTKEQRRVYQALGDERSNYSEMEIDAMAAEIAALERKKQAIADVQSVSDTMQSALSDGFMSMVDGTATVEDAFRSMAQSIIKQLYEVMVVQRLVGQYDAASKTGTGLVGALMKGIAGIVSPQVAPAVSQAYGGAWSGGSPVTAYANGGVVNSPTMFGMSGGRRGLMGEAGPEAILPLKRTSSGKLGVAVAGGGTNTVTEHVNISNVFNVTGSDADTVRREIEKALPRISEVTKASVLDARRRGGKMMATFG
jgi:lambda family phage tail tape measure protein